MFQPFQTLQVQLHYQLFYIIHSENFTLFTILFYSFPLFQFKIYNYNCTIPILQLQTSFYNCTNCHQLHVKICPGTPQSVDHILRLSKWPNSSFLTWKLFGEEFTLEFKFECIFNKQSGRLLPSLVSWVWIWWMFVLAEPRYLQCASYGHSGGSRGGGNPVWTEVCLKFWIGFGANNSLLSMLERLEEYRYIGPYIIPRLSAFTSVCLSVNRLIINEDTIQYNAMQIAWSVKCSIY